MVNLILSFLNLLDLFMESGSNREIAVGTACDDEHKESNAASCGSGRRRQQLQTVEQVQNGGNEQPQPHNGLEQPQNLNETDARDGQVASSFTHTSERRRVHHEDDQDQVDIPEEADPTTVLLLKELQKTNRLIRLQGDRIHELERKRRYRPPSRRHYRSRSYSSSRSPPRRYRRRSPSSSRSPPRRYHRQRSYSRSPRRKSRKNQRPETTETGSLSPEQDPRDPSKVVLKPRERSPPRDGRTNPGRAQGKS
ncbi:pre-mRNA-splicing factor CWC22-like [Vicia villosa]|uniref:pre-mRNA-splicing factor CWC22-like n=1 Tax=Vicia villosa TaxID=3911 RepID=UPI00273B462C|nr:pre-mRNA-splicing factor CWC22-like [Vicia villosa]